jgi:hypothetical protein
MCLMHFEGHVYYIGLEWLAHNKNQNPNKQLQGSNLRGGEKTNHLVALLLSPVLEIWGGREHSSATGEEAADWETRGSMGEGARTTGVEPDGRQRRRRLPNPSFALLSPLLWDKALRSSLDGSRALWDWKRSRRFCSMAFAGNYIASLWGGMILVGWEAFFRSGGAGFFSDSMFLHKKENRFIGFTHELGP